MLSTHLFILSHSHSHPHSFHSAPNSNSKCSIKKQTKRYQNLFLSSGKMSTQENENLLKTTYMLYNSYKHPLTLTYPRFKSIDNFLNHTKRLPHNKIKSNEYWIYDYISHSQMIFTYLTHVYMKFGCDDLEESYGWAVRCAPLYVCEWVWAVCAFWITLHRSTHLVTHV